MVGGLEKEQECTRACLGGGMFGAEATGGSYARLDDNKGRGRIPSFKYKSIPPLFTIMRCFGYFNMNYVQK